MKLPVKNILVAATLCCSATVSQAQEPDIRTFTGHCYDSLAYVDGLENNGFLQLAWGENDYGVFSLHHNPDSDLFYLALTPYNVRKTCVVFTGKEIHGAYTIFLQNYIEQED